MDGGSRLSLARAWVSRHELLVYFALAYALSWAWWIPIDLSDHGILGSPWHSKVPGIVGPLIAAVFITALVRGREGMGALAAAMFRWRVGWPALVVALSPLGFFAIAVVVDGALGHGWPAPAGLGRMLGWPDVGLLGFVGLVVVVSGFGEETGWRGFALPRLQARYSALMATVVLAVLWAGWHTPLFLMREGLPVKLPLLPVFYAGLFCGAVVLTWIYNRSGGSILMAGLFHVSNNIATATDAADAFVQAAVSIAIMVVGITLVVLEIRSMRRGTPSVIGPATQRYAAMDGLTSGVGVSPRG